MSYIKIAVLTVIGVLVALIGFAFYPSTTAHGAGIRQNQPGPRDADEAAERLREPRYPIDAWTPRPPLEMQYAPKARVLELSTTNWTSIGPSPLANTSPADPNFNVSGRIVAVAAHPTDSNTIYIAAAGGGVWRTANGGTTWTPLTDSQVTLSMGALAISKSNPMVIYAGTGEANNSLDSNFGRGILVSSDGGTTWTLRTGPANVFSVNRMACSKIVIDPTNASVAYAAMSDAAANGIFANGITGVYKTTDGGVNWANVTAANGKDSLFPWSDAAVDPNTTSTLYGAVGYLFGTANNAGYKSIDTGGTWNVLNAANAPVGASFGRISLAISKAGNPNVLYEAAEDNTATGAISRFVRSDNGGTSFTDLTAGTPNYVGSAGWYNQTLIVDPTTSAIVYVAGQAGANSILRSVNSGVNWTGIGNGGAPNFTSPHPDHHGADFDAVADIWMAAMAVSTAWIIRPLLPGAISTAISAPSSSTALGCIRLMLISWLAAVRITAPSYTLATQPGWRRTAAMAASPSSVRPMATACITRFQMGASARISSGVPTTAATPGSPRPPLFRVM